MGVKEDDEMVDVITIRYRCPECASQEELNFEVPETDREIKFHCTQCKFENSIRVKWNPEPEKPKSCYFVSAGEWSEIKGHVDREHSMEEAHVLVFGEERGKRLYQEYLIEQESR